MSKGKISRRLHRIVFDQGRALRGRKARMDGERKNATKIDGCSKKGGASFPAQRDWNCTKYSRQRRHVQGDLPLRTPQRGSGKSEQSQ